MMLPSSFFPCTTWLLPIGLLATLSTGEIEFYRDAIPEKSEEMVFQQLAKYLESQNHRHDRGIVDDLRQRRLFEITPLQSQQSYKNRLLELARQKERDLLKTLESKKSIDNMRRKLKFNPWKYQQELHYNDPLNDLIPDREYDAPYYNSDDMSPIANLEEYSPFFKLSDQNSQNQEQIMNKDMNNDRRKDEYNRGYKQNFAYYPKETAARGFIFDEEVDDNEEAKDRRTNDGSLFELPEMKQQINNHPSKNGNLGSHRDEKPVLESRITVPEFTYRFNNDNLNDEHPFAIKPNDPRYYQESDFSTDTKNNLNREEVPRQVWEGDNRQSIPSINKEPAPDLTNKNADKNNEEYMAGVDINDNNSDNNNNNDKHAKNLRFEDLRMSTLPEPERHTRYHPVVVPVTQNLNNDIYFIAIVAGCSAAAMFALVLIGLTWCRLQRDAKAAADIEYPAYGVTGPNKDVSPSGDQRLAQSAQMYHFQHQKQQIIAMEKASATRDPGSVSEAESDEENEEGDYTVYECPGLAPTGEMEVKNPLFHDDPTPATPAQSNTEDHM